MAGDFEAARSLYAPGATWTLAGDLPLSGTWTGPDRILGESVPAMRDRLEMDSLEFEFEGVLGEGEPVLAEWNTRGASRTGRPGVSARPGPPTRTPTRPPRASRP